MPPAGHLWVAGSTLGNGSRKSRAWAGVKAARWTSDENGWVRSLAVDQYVENVIMDSHGHYPAGRYIVLYDCPGTIEYRGTAQKDIAASRQGVM